MTPEISLNKVGSRCWAEETDSQCLSKRVYIFTCSSDFSDFATFRSPKLILFVYLFQSSVLVSGVVAVESHHMILTIGTYYLLTERVPTRRQGPQCFRMPGYLGSWARTAVFLYTTPARCFFCFSDSIPQSATAGTMKL